MPIFSLEQADRRELVETIHELIPYLSDEERSAYLELADALEAGEEQFDENPLEAVLELGARTWPAREAIRSYLKEEGSESEWEQVFAHARPTTVLLLQRLRKQTDVPHLEGVLESSSAGFAIHENEAEELSLLRAEISKALWREQAEALQSYREDAEKAFEKLQAMVEEKREAGTLADQGVWKIYIERQPLE